MKKIFFLFLLMGGVVQAQTIDQTFTGVENNYEILESGGILVKQSFKAGISGTLYSANLDLEVPSCPNLAGVFMDLTVYDSTETIIIASKTEYLSCPTSRNLFQFVFASTGNIQANHSYIMTLWTQGGLECDSTTHSPGSVYWYHSMADSVYTNGTSFSNTAPLNWDMYFNTSVYPCAIPISPNPSVVGFEMCGQGDGSVTCNPTGGSGSYNYSWSNGGTTQTISNLVAGSYSVTVTDAGFCTATAGLNLTNAGAPVYANDTAVATTCFGSSDGYVSVTVTAGTPPYTYQWNTSDTNSFISGVLAGMYIYTVTDINLCTHTDTLIVTQPNQISASFITNNESCLGGDGSIDMTPIGDHPPFGFLWSIGPATEDISGLFAGPYQVVITDGNGCNETITETVYVNPGSAIDTTLLDLQNNICFQMNGHISNLGTAVTTSNPPLNFQINSQSVPMSGLYNLSAGAFNLVATDVLGCRDSVTINILDLGSPISVMQGSTYTPPCADVCTGTISVLASGGSGPLTYTWDNGLTGANVMNLCAGDYEVLVTDTLGCSNSGIMSILPASPMDISFSSNNPNCGISDGDVTASVLSGGSAPFTFDWSNGDNTAMADSLSAGNYSVNVVDINGCKAFRYVALNSLSGPTVTDILTNPSCNGSSDGAIDLTISGGSAPIDIQWSTGHITEDISSLSAGVYDVTVSDASGCVIINSYTLNDPTPIEIAPNITLAACSQSDGGIDLNATGGTGTLNYLWDSNAGNATTSSITNFPAGIYTVDVTDANGCIENFHVGLSNANSPSVTVDQVVHPNCQTGGGAMYITATGGTSPYSYLWNNGSTSADLENVAEGIYALTITDASNCQAHAAFVLPGINIFAQEICMITVDSVTNMNKVIWEKTTGIGIEEFRVYRETSVTGNFHLVGKVSFDSLSVFQDTVASSDIHAWKYKLATVDSCGNESSFIASHKSIHLITSVNANWDVLLEWDDYIGFSYPEFYINRYHISNGWTVIDTVPNYVHTYVDPNAPNGNVGYSITVPAPSNCTPSRVGVNTSRSNVKNQPIAAPNGVVEEELFSCSVYPNPSVNELNVSLGNYKGEALTMKFYNAIGEVILIQKLNSSNTRVDTKEIPSGLYTISISSDKNTLIKKVMILK